jgi:hypothetical protein
MQPSGGIWAMGITEEHQHVLPRNPVRSLACRMIGQGEWAADQSHAGVDRAQAPGAHHQGRSTDEECDPNDGEGNQGLTA